MKLAIEKAEDIICKKGIKCIIFDLDGTLLFTKKANTESYKSAFKSIGIKINKEEYNKAFGLRFEKMIIKVAPNLQEKDIKKIKTAKIGYYRKNINLVKPNTILIDYLKKKHKDKNILICLATTASKINAKFLLEHFKLINFFDFILYGESVKKGKPNPECYLKCMRKFKIKSKNVLIFEDSESGIEAAILSGAKYIKIP